MFWMSHNKWDLLHILVQRLLPKLCVQQLRLNRRQLLHIHVRIILQQQSLLHRHVWLQILVHVPRREDVHERAELVPNANRQPDAKLQSNAYAFTHTNRDRIYDTFAFL